MQKYHGCPKILWTGPVTLSIQPNSIKFLHNVIFNIIYQNPTFQVRKRFCYAAQLRDQNFFAGCNVSFITSSNENAYAVFKGKILD